jgi:hypothetical protein
MNKDEVQSELQFFWMLVVKCSVASPMLGMLLSVEELESLVTPYCHVFQNHLHFLPLLLLCHSTSSCFNQAMVLIICHHRLLSRPCLYLIFHIFSFTS